MSKDQVNAAISSLVFVGKGDPVRKDIGFEEWYASVVRPVLTMREPDKDNRLFFSYEQLRGAWISGATSTPSETAMPEPDFYWDTNEKQLFPSMAAAELWGCIKSELLPLYKAAATLNDEQQAMLRRGQSTPSAIRANIPCQLCGVAEGEKCKLTDSVHQEKHPACPANRHNDKNGAPRRGDGLKLYASIFREFFPNHQGEIELSAAVLEEMAERISLAWTTPSATRANERNIFVDEDHKRGCEGRSYRCTCGYDEKVMTRGNELEARLSTPPQRYSIVLANGVVTWITTVDGEWVQWDDVQRQYVHGEVKKVEPFQIYKTLCVSPTKCREAGKCLGPCERDDDIHSTVRKP